VLKEIIFVTVTLVLALVSRASLRKPGSHGFYRFFAWEFMLGIFVLNMHAWYAELGSVHQYIARILLAVSLFLAITGLGLLLQSGNTNTHRNDVPMLEFEKTTKLVTSGIYQYIRHPLYSSLFFLCGSFFFKQPSLTGGLLAVIACGFLIATVRAEEIENTRHFGDQYLQYMNRTKMFIPFIL